MFIIKTKDGQHVIRILAIENGGSLSYSNQRKVVTIGIADDRPVACFMTKEEAQVAIEQGPSGMVVYDHQFMLMFTELVVVSLTETTLPA